MKKLGVALLSIVCSFLFLSGLGLTVEREASAELITEDAVTDPTNFDYSFAVLGDTQKIVKQYVNGENANFPKIYDYILENVSDKKIAHVFGLGDIVETTWPFWGSEEQLNKEIAVAVQQISRMDGVVDYSLNRGNHDTVELYEEYFGVNSTATGYASHIEDYCFNSSNSIHYFTAGELDYMVVTLDFGASDSVLNWASKKIAEHPYHNVIITTHSYMYRDGTTLDVNDVCPPLKPWGANDDLFNAATGTANNGDHMWNKLISKHPNIVLAMSGHDPSENIVCSQWQGVNGNVVTNMLIDPQDMDLQYAGGIGAVAMFYLSNGGKTVEVRYWSTAQERYIHANNQFTFTLNTIDADFVTARKMIDALPAVNALTAADANTVNKIQTLVNSLSPERKAKVENIHKLNEAVIRIKQLLAPIQAQKVIDLIAGLPTDINARAESNIISARNAYNALSEDVKALVTNVNSLTAIETTLTINKFAAQSVMNAINRLPANATLEDEDAVAAVRTAYDNLTKDQKTFVTNYYTLILSENAIAALKDSDSSPEEENSASEESSKDDSSQNDNPDTPTTPAIGGCIATYDSVFGSLSVLLLACAAFFITKKRVK